MTSRERRTDTVAKCMGELLLKGYKMLSTSCDACNNVMLQDKQGAIICVNCNEEVKNDQPPKKEVREDATATNRIGDFHEDRSTKPTDSAEILLMMEITSASQCLETLAPGADLQHKQMYIRHIRECAETIHALRMIK